MYSIVCRYILSKFWSIAIFKVNTVKCMKCISYGISLNELVSFHGSQFANCDSSFVGFFFEEKKTDFSYFVNIRALFQKTSLQMSHSMYCALPAATFSHLFISISEMNAELEHNLMRLRRHIFINKNMKKKCSKLQQIINFTNRTWIRWRSLSYFEGKFSTWHFKNQ